VSDLPTGPEDPTAPGGTPGDRVDAGDPPVVESRVARRRRAQRPVPGRTTAIVVAGAVVFGVALVSALVPPPTVPLAPPAGEGVSIAPADASSSSFFCATGAGVDAGSGATGAVVLTNTSHTAATGVMSTVGTSGGAPVRRPLVVPPLGTAEVTPAAGLPPEATASTFSFLGGGVTGTAIISGPSGWSTAPCASEVWPQWDFAGGSTSTGLLDLSLYNPTAATTVVDVTFLTATGNVLVPQPYQGISVPAGALVVEGLGAYVQNQSVVATLVQATSGALVATELDQMVLHSGTGLALFTGAPAPADTWRFAQTTTVPGGSVALVLANPGASPVSAEVSVGLSAASVEAHQVTVPGQTVVSFEASSVAGWPLRSPYSLTVSASAPIVVGRTVVGPPGAVAPNGGITMGTTTTSTSWLVVGPGAPGNPPVPGASRESLAVVNPGSASVAVTVTPLAGGTPVATFRVPGNGVTVLGAPEVRGLRPVVVVASAPVSVEADSGPSGAPGSVSSSGFPF
jgi:hypothetical protein